MQQLFSKKYGVVFFIQQEHPPSLPRYNTSLVISTSTAILICMNFAWDTEKAETNLKKHGVSLEEAKSIFYDPLSITIDDPHQPVHEQRLITIGQSLFNNLLIVVHTEITESTIRIISARKASKHERKQYENRS